MHTPLRRSPVPVLILALLLAAAPLLAAPVGVTVLVENRAPTGGTWLTPVWVGFHGGSFDLFDDGAAASLPLERLAEDGNTAPLASLFDQSAATGRQGVLATGGAMPQLAPGESASLKFVVDSGDPASRFLSWASMVIPSNDAFIADDDPQAHRIFDTGGGFLGDFFMVTGDEVRDAGTEVNDEIPAHTAFFGQETPDSGVDEDGVVHDHPGYLPPGSGGILDDPDFAAADFTVPGYEVARVTVYRSDTVVPGGPVTGTWSAADSPYILQGDVSVPAGETLAIEPGVVVYCAAERGITVHGSLEALGSEDAPIRFTGPAGGVGWTGLRFENTTTTSYLQHCIVERGDRQSTYEAGGGIACVNATLEIHHGTIRDNRAFTAGAGIYAVDSELVLDDCDIGGNLIDSSNSAAGGGLYAENCQLQLTASRLHDNRVETFTYFGATNSRGGGLALVGTSGLVDHCLVDGNYITHSGTEAESTGGGIYVDGGASDGPLLRGNTIVDNEVNYTNAHGGGVYLIGYYVELVDNVVAGNVGAGVWFDGGAETAAVSYNDFWANSEGDLGGGFVPAGLGAIVQDNANGDPCDAEFNIFLDPQFVSPGADDYHLLSGSPCIDAGDPGAPQDPDGTVADIGAFFFRQEITATPPTRSGGTRLLMGARPAPMTGSTSIVFRLPEAGPVRLTVYDVRGHAVRTLLDGEQPAGQRSVTFDGRDDGGRELPAGVYLYRLQAAGHGETDKITILR